ncbi:hypothetical protein PTSG_04663 [Salpingoeca rosetta]|uniref:Uncharacterized protein n=1 Tax=Salpingoeca rosetta (strain ATCC 50818 / BSB-021) TaxID=946362 RepID=F2U827_SALR5|nr:uncharacterized protein PTSG_04663 [Salpingoeca rosetta]EGD72932.1 hypothetical protein PTSG_04663 [Salpingoeca rosetta]|eukprot:XP_004994754.1 hypothetical protein PTSG_04663 [Salpingoeca rosetta]
MALRGLWVVVVVGFVVGGGGVGWANAQSSSSGSSGSSDDGPPHAAVIANDQHGNLHVNTTTGRGHVVVNNVDLTAKTQMLWNNTAAIAATHARLMAAHESRKQVLDGLTVGHEFLRAALDYEQEPSVADEVAYVLQTPSHNSAADVVVDPAGGFVCQLLSQSNVVVACANAATGMDIWSKTVSDGPWGNALALDATATRLFVAGKMTSSLIMQQSAVTAGAFVACFDAENGTPLWSAPFPGPHSFASLAVSGSGDAVYVAGQSTGAFLDNAHNRDSDIIVARLNATTGNVDWSAQIGSGDNDNAKGVAVDEQGNVYVAGLTEDPRSFGGSIFDLDDAVVIKYSSDGRRSWISLLSTVGEDSCYDITADGQGGVVVACRSSVIYEGPDASARGSSAHFFVARVNTSDGGIVWWAHTSTDGSGDTYARAIVMDSARKHVVLTGYTEYALSRYRQQGTNDLFVVKMAAATGEVVWSTQIGSPETAVGYGVAVDAADNIYVAGAVRNELVGLADHGASTTTGQTDAVLVKFFAP